LEKLATMSHSKKIIPAVIEFVDIAGLVKGASLGEGLGNKFLANIRETDAIVQVVRVFENPNIIHVHKKIDPENDIEIINSELILADLETINKVKIRLEKDKRGNKKGAAQQLIVLEKIQKNLEAGILAHETKLDLADENTEIIVRELSLLTMKPFLYVFNVTDYDAPLPKNLIVEKDHIHPVKSSEAGAKQFNGVKLDIKIEEELIAMSQEEAKELEIKSNIDSLIIKAYEILGLITFLTTGEDETRAWTIKKNSTAPVAGMAIHTDFKEKFIRADVIEWNKLLEIGSWSKAREVGQLRTEGKEYVVQDGDVVEFKI